MSGLDWELLTKDIWQILPIGVVIHDGEGKILQINKYGADLLNIHPLQVVGQSSIFILWDVIHSDGKTCLPTDLPSMRARQTKRPVRNVVLGVRQEKTKWLLLDSIPKLKENGELIGIITTFRDITEEKELEQDLRTQSRKIQALFDHSFNGVVVLHRNRVVEANVRFAQMLGYSLPELLQLQPKDWEPQIQDSLKPIGVNAHIYQTTHYRKDGSSYDAEVFISNLDIAGQEFYLYVVRDITRRNQAERALKETREQFSNIFRSIPDGVCLIDRQYVFRYVNHVMLERLNLTESQIIGHTIAEIKGQDFFLKIKPKFDLCLRGQEVRFSEWISYPALGKRFKSIVLSPYQNDRGEILGVVEICRDETDRKLIEEKLEASRKQDRVINKIAQNLLESWDYVDIFSNSLPILRDYLQADRVVAYQFQNFNKVEVLYSANAPGVKSMFHCNNKYIVSSHIWQKNRVEVVSDVVTQKYSPDYLEFLSSYDIRSHMVIGIWSDQKLWGAMSVHQNRVRVWDKLETELIRRYSTLLGIAISRSDLYHKTQSQLNQASLLYRLADYTKETIDLQQIFDFVTQELWQIYPVGVVFIHQFLPDRQIWENRSRYPREIEVCTVEHQDNPLSQLLLENKIVAIEDTNILDDPANRKVAQQFRGAWLIVPIYLNDGVWGAISLQLNTTYVWEDETKLFIQTIADQIAGAINKHREVSNRRKAELALINANNSLEEMVLNRTRALTESQLLLRQKYEQEHILNLLSNRLRDSLDLEQTLQTITQELRALVNCDRVIVYGILRDGVGEVIAESVKPEIPSLMGMRFTNEVFPQECYNDYLNGRIGIIDTTTDVQCLREFMVSLGVKSSITIGISFDQKLWGLLILHQCSHDRVWEQNEISLLQKIVVPVSIAIKQSDLYRRMGEALKQRIEANRFLERKLAEERIINFILEQIRYSANLNQILDLIATELRVFLNADRVAITLIENNKVIATFQSPNDSPITSLNCELILPRFADGNYFADQYRVLLPIVDDKNHIWGLLTVINYIPTNYDGGTVKLLHQVTNYLGIAIEKAKMQQNMESELRQKNALLKEVHHRVKNNLQIMSSLLRLQTRNLDKSLNPIIEDAQSRIFAMALVHEQLYSTNNFDSMDINKYVTSLISTIFNTYNVRSDQIELVINIPKITIPLDKTVPLGLIFNELITNAVKYAFPDGKGQLRIDVTQSDQTIEIRVADNGVGLPADFDVTKVKSLGMLLISDLTDQLEGTFTCHNDNGAVFTIVFPNP